MLNFLIRKGDKSPKTPLNPEVKGDFLSIMRDNPKYFAEIEHKLTHKSVEEILKEISLGLRLNNISFEETLTEKKTIAIIPPKYELWLYFLLAIRFSHSGYKVIFLYHNWSNSLIDQIKPSLSYLKYQNLSISNAEDYIFLQSEDVLILNFADSYNGIASTVPGFSTAIVSKDSDLDYVMAYIFANAFSFAGMKKSNLKRIIIDEDIKAEFEKRVYSRLVSIDNFNTTKITSSRVKIQIHQIVSDAISEGADLILGGDDFENDNYNNVILNNVTREMRVFQKSFFGPVLQLTYTSFEPKILNKIIDQQPSRGLVLFSNDNKFVSLHQSCFRGRDHVIRPVDNERNISGIIEYNPSLETMFKMLGIKGE